MQRKAVCLLIWILCSFGNKIIAQINHAEPLNWYTGMKNPALQLLINGNNISETTPQINYPGVSIKKINKADSKNYLFLDLLIAKNTKPGTFTINFKKDSKTVFTYDYTLLERQTEAAQIKGFNSSDAIYLITPDRFVNGDESNDVVEGMLEKKVNRANEGARHGGDIRGIINHLDYIKDMGFTAIWPTPLLENDMPAYSYHGYAITNHYKTDPRYGTLDDYKELSARAKQKGIKLIFDEVLNHTGSNYWWMNDLPFKNWLNYPDKYTPTNHRRTVNEDLYASNFDKDLWVRGWFDKTMPDMNGQNPFMQNYLIQSTIWWIETLQLGGIRQDTYAYSDKIFLKNWSCTIMNEYPNFNIVGEEWSTNPLITSYWQKGKQNHNGNISCLPTIMDFPIQDALVQSLTGQEGESFNSPFTPDLGGVKRARNFARIMERDFITCSKYRKKANEIAEMNVIGDVEGMDVVLVDDMVDTAGTLCKAAEVIMKKGAKSVRAMATHAVLSGKAFDNINNSVLTELVVCDTMPLKQESPKIKVLSTAKLFARAIRNTHENRSIEALFDN